MSDGINPAPIDLIRWTFTIDPERRVDLEAYLADLGLDVVVRDDRQFVVSWEEPDRDLDEVIQELWAIYGEPFELTHEEFHRQALLSVNPAEGDEASRDVA